jgi:prepilin-type N-terminal cleavage/methylation domain-containing protein
MTRRIRQGFTLVELLVVIAIMVVLYGLMLARLAPGAGRQCRDAANALATALNEAWSRGLGNPAGSALVIESAGTMSVSLASASVPPPIEGSITGPVGGSVSVNATDPAGLANGYRIQFFRTGSGAVSPSPWFGYANGVLSLRAAAGQTADNTIWPIGDGLQCRVLCRPVKAERVATLPKMAAIDQRASGIESNAAYASLAGKGDITVAFDGFGGVAGLWVAGVEVPPAPVYFLVAAQADIERSQAAPLASGVSRWVVVSPQSGRVTVAANNPAATVSAARAFARPGASSGR